MLHDSCRQCAKYSQPRQFLPYAIATQQEQQLINQILAAQDPVAPNTPRREPPEEKIDKSIPAPPAEEAEEEVPEQVRKQWLSTLRGFAQSHYSYETARANDTSGTVNVAMLTRLSCYWPLIRMTLNARGAISRFHTALRLLGQNDKAAQKTCQRQFDDLEIMAIQPLAVSNYTLHGLNRHSCRRLLN